MSDIGTIVRRQLAEVEVPDLTLKMFHARRQRQARNRRLMAGAVAAAIVVTGAIAFLNAVRAEPLPADVGPTPVSVSPTNGVVAFSAVAAEDFPGDWPSKDDPADIYLSVPGEEPRRILGADGDGIHQSCPAFSPDGTMLAYTEGTVGMVHPLGDTRLLVVELDDQGSPAAAPVEVLVDTLGRIVSCPEWAPDGTRLAVPQEGHGMTIVTPDAELSSISFGKFEEGGIHGSREFAWSPDGTTLAVIEREEAVWLVPVDGAQEPTVLSLGSPSTFRYLFSVAWSPDGTRIAIGGGVGTVAPGSSTCCESRHVLEIVSVETGEVQEVPVDRGAIGHAVGGLSWLRDDALAMVGERGPALVDPVSGSITTIEKEYLGNSDIVWSPDERWFLYNAYDRSRAANAGSNAYALIAQPIDGSRPPIRFSAWTVGLRATNETDLSWRPIIP